MLALGALGIGLLLAGCGGATLGASTAAGPAHQAQNGTFGGATTTGQPYNPAVYATPGVASTAPGSPATPAKTQNAGPGVYLIKSLEVDMSVSDPRQTAADLQQWITATDPRAITAGANYQRQDDGTYQVQMTYSVEVALYPQVETYLAGYAPAHKGHLDALHENVQDVSSQYVDLQSRLTNLRGEQQRLLDLLAHSTTLTDTLAIEDRLTTVEGEIEQIEGQQTELAGQTTFYAVSINLAPLSGGTATPPPAPWSPGAIAHGAWGAALVFGQVLADVLIWLGVFAIYIVPVLLIVWLVRRWLRRRRAAIAPPASPATT
jgi:hypothetical protein